MNTDKHRFAALVFCLACVLACSVGFAFAQGKKKAPAKPLDLNAATVEELKQLPEVGQKLAEAIVRFREKSGPFKRVEELLAIPGITKRRLEKIRPHVFVAEGKKTAELASPLTEVTFDLHQCDRNSSGQNFESNDGSREEPQGCDRSS